MPRAESTKISTQFYSSAPAPPALPPKKKHVCPTCERAFTTSGHLARHTRIHTGERNHKCPFPGCETRCSRQDNLQQQWVSRCCLQVCLADAFFSYRIHLSPGSRRNSRRPGGAKRAAAAERPIDRPPPTLEDVSVYAHHLTPPDSPVPLVQPIIPVDGPTPPPLPSTPEQAYYGLADSPYVSYSYRSATTTYQEQGQGSGFTYIHTTPLTSASHDGSRRSISHIMSYPASPASSPASSNPASSHGSGPPTPTYIYDEAHTRYNTATTFDHSNHQIYSADDRFQSPPPILAPIHDRRDHFLPAYLYRSCPHPIV